MGPIPSRYSLSKFAKAVRNPKLFIEEARRVALSVNAAYSRFTPPDSVCDVVAEEWDSLIVLDGCRYDLFEEVNTFENEPEYRISAGSESWEFLRENFEGRKLHDTIYVTANPHAPKLSSGTFFQTVNLLDSHWDEELRTVTPQAMTQEALKIHSEHPDKRLIIHYMQPHFPFIGEKGQQIAHSGINTGDQTDDSEGRHIWFGLRDNKLDLNDEAVYEAYRENLDLTLPHVHELISGLDGLSVVTSDHGNMVGDKTGPIPVKGYGHPRGFHTTPLVKVPWLRIDSGERRVVTAEPPLESRSTKMDSETVADRLADLGYT